MEKSSSLKLIMEKGPREGETLEYTSPSVVKIGRVVTGNTIGIRDAGISSKHIRIQFNKELSKWTISDLDSSNGTILNGQRLQPNVPSDLNDGDCIKIGEITSMIVKIGVEAGAADRGIGLGLGFDGDLGKDVVDEPVQKRNLRSRAKKAVDSKNDSESLSSKRTLRSSRKEVNVSFIPTLKQIPEDLDVDERKTTDPFVPVEDKKTQGRGNRGAKKKLPLQLHEDSNLDERTKDSVVSVEAKKTQRGGNRGKKKLPMEDVENSGLEEILDNNNESVQAEVDKGKEAAEDSENKQDGGDDSMKEIGPDNTNQCLELEKMTLGDFFDYLEVQLRKEIYDKSENIISDMTEKAQKCHEFRLQRNEIGNHLTSSA